MTNIIGKFKDEAKLLAALVKLKENKVNLVDVCGPFATHAMIKKFTRESRLPYLAVIYGFIGMVSMFGLIYYTAVIDYPIMYGGKPIFSFPPMVVLMFLFTILVATILLVLTFHGRTQHFPGKAAKIINPDVTDDTFYLVVGQNYNPEDIKGWLMEKGAVEILEKEWK